MMKINCMKCLWVMLAVKGNKSGKGVGMGRCEDVRFKEYDEGRSHSKDDDV